MLNDHEINESSNKLLEECASFSLRIIGFIYITVYNVYKTREMLHKTKPFDSKSRSGKQLTVKAKFPQNSHRSAKYTR